MGAGKTTLGRALAKRLGREFIDLDFYIQQRFRKSVSEIFAERGEREFRRMESEMLREVGEFEDVVISCGGGAPCFNSNLDYMKGRGLTVCLTASMESLMRRLTVGASRRPLLAGKSEEELRSAIEKGLLERAPFYGAAHAEFAGDELENRSEIDASVERFLKIFKESI